MNAELQKVFGEMKGGRQSSQQDVSTNEILCFFLELLESHLLQLALPWLEGERDEVFESNDTAKAIRELAVELRSEEPESSNSLITTAWSTFLYQSSLINVTIPIERVILLSIGCAIVRQALSNVAIPSQDQWLHAAPAFREKIVKFGAHLNPPLLQSNAITTELKNFNDLLKAV